MAAEIKGLVEKANAFYTISFYPPRADQVDEYHDLKVEVANPDLAANTDTGYYDQPDFYDQHAPAQRVTVEQLEQMLGKPTAGIRTSRRNSQAWS
jgi:hypothetical protein